MEEVVWKIDSFRRNLMWISLIAMLLIISWGNIEKINILWIIVLKGIDNVTFLITFISIHFYMLYRYYTYYIKLNFRLNYDLLFHDLIKFHHDIIKWIHHNNTIIKSNEISFEKDWKIRFRQPNLKTKNILEAINPFFWNKNNFCDMYKTDNDRIVRLITQVEWHADLVLKISIPKYSIKTLYILVKLYILEKNVIDYIWPILFWSITILLLCYKLISL